MQEVMRAILDGLHEALNRVKVAAPYRDLYLEPKPEIELAELTWRYHKSCHDSIIQDIFCGIPTSLHIHHSLLSSIARIEDFKTYLNC